MVVSVNDFEAIVSQYLYGSVTVPDNKTDSALIRENSVESLIFISAQEYFTTGPGRFAVGAMSSLVDQFFRPEIFATNGKELPELPAGSYSKQELAEIFKNTAYGINFQQYNYIDGVDDLAVRTFLWNSTALQLSNSPDLRFVVEADGTKYIQNYSLDFRGNLPENFDFVSSDWVAQSTAEYLQDRMDLSHIGRTVNLSYTGNSPIIAHYGTDDFNEGLIKLNDTFTTPADFVYLLSGVNDILDSLWANGVTKFLDPGDRPIIYGTTGSEILSTDGVFDGSGENLVDPSDNSYFSDHMGNGIALVAGDGNDILAAGSLVLSGNDPIQQLRTDLQSEELYKTSHAEWNDNVRDILVGGAGNDIYIVGGGFNKLNTKLTDAQLNEVSKLDLIDGSDADFTAYAQWQNNINDNNIIVTAKMTAADLSNPRTWGDKLAFDGALVKYYDIKNKNSITGILTGERLFDQASGEALLMIGGMVNSTSSPWLFGVRNYLTFNPQSSDGWHFMGKGSGGGAGAGGASRAMAALADSGVQNAEASNAADIDEITTGNGKDYVYARSGDDLIHLGLYGGGDDYADGGAGFDTADYTGASSNLSISFEENYNIYTGLSAYWAATGADIGTDALLNIERIIGGSGNDSITGSGGNDTLAGGGGNDVIDGGAGVDTLDFSMHTTSVTVLFSSTGTGSATGTQSGNDTFTKIENVTGSQGDDIVTGDSQNNVIYGQAGDDVIRGMLGDDTIFGELGNDIIYGGDGADSLQGGDGDDTIYIDQYDTWYSGDDGIDTLIFIGAGSLSYSLGQGSFENVTTSDGNDTIWGTDGANIINLGAGDDTAQGYGGDDIINGGAGADSLIGGDGNDTIYIDKDDTWYSGDAGIDTLIFTGTGSLSYALAQGGFENVTTAAGNDTIWGTDDANIIDLGAGDDSAQGYGGDDIIIGGAGADSLQGGDGNDTIYVDQDDTWYSGDDGIDTIIFTGAGSLTYALAQGGFENATTAAGDDTIWGTDDANIVNLGGGNDVAMTYAGNDVVDGGDGNDFIDGGVGNDTLTGGAGNDTFAFHAGFGQDTITDFTAGAGSVDVIQVDTNVFADFAAVMNAASQVGSDTLITADASNVITLKNVTLSSLHQDDFSFAVAS